MNSPVHHDDQPHIISRNARSGLALFAIYVCLYAGFIYLAVFRWDTLASEVFAGVNLAIVYGMGLIGAAFVLALVYMLLCRGPKSAGEREGGNR